MPSPIAEQFADAMTVLKAEEALDMIHVGQFALGSMDEAKARQYLLQLQAWAGIDRRAPTLDPGTIAEMGIAFEVAD